MIPQYKPYVDRVSLAKELSDYALTQGYFTEYKYSRLFEKQIEKFIKTNHCYVLNNGTISLSLALLALGIRDGDYVLVPSLSMIATANAVALIGAIPVFVDVNHKNLCMDLEKAKEAINKSKEVYIQSLQTFSNTNKIKAVIYVTLNGRSHSRKEYDTFLKFCQYNDVGIIEDNAQSFGSKWDNNKFISCPKYGYGSFSFSMPKIITTGQGGCLVTDNQVLAHRIQALKDFGRYTSGHDIHERFGINCKFTEMQAVLGLNQIKDIKYRVNRKREIYKKYYDILTKIPQLSMFPLLDNETPWFVDIYIKNKDDLQNYLYRNDIMTRQLYPPIHKQKCYEGYNNEKYVTTEYFSNRGVWLPCYLDIRDNEINKITDKIKEFFNEK